MDPSDSWYALGVPNNEPTIGWRCRNRRFTTISEPGASDNREIWTMLVWFRLGRNTGSSKTTGLFSPSVLIVRHLSPSSIRPIPPSTEPSPLEEPPIRGALAMTRSASRENGRL